MSTPRVITLLGPKGGVGTTTLTINLAVALKEHHATPTAVCELSITEGEELRLLGASGLRVVSGASASGGLQRVLPELLETHQFVLIDAGSVLTPRALDALEHAHLMLLITTPDVICLERMKQTIKQLESLNVPLRMVKVVLNRAESHGNFRSSQVRQSLPLEIIAEIPSDGRTVSLSLNQSVPFVQASPKSRISQAVDDWAKHLVSHPELFVEHVALDHQALPTQGAESLPIAALNGQAATASPADPMIALKKRIHGRMVERLDLKRLDLKAMNDPLKAREIRGQVEQVILDLLVEEQGFVSDPDRRKRLVKELIDDFMGLGPLEDLIEDQEVSDILVNGPDMIYVEKRGRLTLTTKKFLSRDQVLTVIERIIAPLGRRIDESNPMVDARLPDGSRVNAVIPPLAIREPVLSIRKFGQDRYDMQDLMDMGSLSAGMAEFLKVCVVHRKNIIVTGGTGSGKTTLLNVLSAFIPDDERIITIEDAAELRLAQQHWIALEARMANVEGKGEVTIRHLFRNTLRMRPDRIIIGECRGDETLDMLQAMNTGHDGSLTTLHANSPQDSIARLDSLVLMSNIDLPVRAIREQIVSAVDLVVHTERLADGSRKVTHVTEITGIDDHSSVTFGDIFLFEQTGIGSNREALGTFRPTGYRPSFLAELRAKGVEIDEGMFDPTRSVQSKAVVRPVAV